MLVWLAGYSSAAVSISLSNAEMTDFAYGVAVDWNSYVAGSPPASGLLFYADNLNFRTAPYAQAIAGIDTPLPPCSDFGTGLCRTASTVPNRIYLFVGYQDIFDPSYLAPPARRYAHFFGINPYGGMTPPQPFEMGSVSWMAPGQWFYNDMPGNSTQVGGLHRCMAAWPARSDHVSVWTGLWAHGDAPAPLGPTVFDIDTHTLFEFDNPARGILANPGFDAVDNLTPGLDASDLSRITLPIYWAPVGGGIGQKESYYTEAAYRRSGSAGLRIYNHRGCLTRGMTQRVTVPTGNYSATLGVYVRSNKNSGTIARVGIDPTGGDDINSASIVWASYTRTDEAWGQVCVTVSCAQSSAVSLFVAASNQPGTTGNVHYADFDDVSLVFGGDLTPPEPFTVTAQSETTLLGQIEATITPLPVDPESGVTSLECAIGTSPGGQDVVPFTAQAVQSDVRATGLSLAPGQTYYATMRATNGNGLSRTASSGAIVCSPRPYAYSWSGVQHLSRNPYNADNVRLAAGPDGDICAVWRESNDITWNGSDSRVMLSKRTGDAWDAPVKVNASPNTWWPDVAWNGDHPVVSYVNPGNLLQNTLRIATGGGHEPFIEQFVRSNVAAFPRLIWGATAGLTIGCNVNEANSPDMNVPSLIADGPAWSCTMLPEGVSAGSDMRVRIAAHGNTIHCLWGRLDSGQPGLYYCSRTGQACSPARLVAAGVASGSIAVDTGGQAHVVYALGGEVWYTHSADGQTWDAATYLGVGESPCVASDGLGKIHVLFYAPTGSNNEYGVGLVSPMHIYRQPDGWSMPTPICAPSSTSKTWTQEPGSLIVDSDGGLHFAWSNNPHDRGWQGNEFQGYYWIDYYTTTPVSNKTGQIAQAKLWGDDQVAAQLGYPSSKVATLERAQVTATGTFPFAVQSGESSVWKSVPFFCVAQPDRASAIKVIAGDAQDSPVAALPIGPDDLVNVSGPIATTNGERAIGYLTSDGVAHGVSFAKSGAVDGLIRPLFMGISALGGAELGLAGGAGVNNLGMLVAVSGKVVSTGMDERGVKVLYIDDGSRVPCGPATGCKVYAPGSTAQTGDFVSVVGVSSIEFYDPDINVAGDEAYIRVVMPRDLASVAVISPHY